MILNAVIYSVFFLLPKKFSPSVTVISLVWGYSIGVLFDFTIGGGLVDLYRVNDSNEYELFDMVYYFLFAPFGYLFFYFYDSLRINRKRFLPYVAAWAAVGVGAHWLFTLLGIINLQKGYQLAYSFPIFLVTQTVTGLFYEKIKSKQTQQPKQPEPERSSAKERMPTFYIEVDVDSRLKQR
nr:hypothetical protein [Paenibacillus turpanensis]